VAITVVGGVIATTRVHTSREAGASPDRAVQLSAGATLAVSRALGGDLTAYRVSPSPSGFLARNPRQRLTASFGAGGATVSTPSGARTSIALQAIGFGATLNAVMSARPLAQANRVEYRRGGTTEWFANGPAGVEQGFTIDSKPAGATDGALTLALGVSGTLTARPSAKGDLVFAEAGGKAVLGYGGPSVTDASGRASRRGLS
jgi:hypothetical protein